MEVLKYEVEGTYGILKILITCVRDDEVFFRAEVFALSVFGWWRWQPQTWHQNQIDASFMVSAALRI
jgi:hypothetical protein